MKNYKLLFLLMVILPLSHALAKESQPFGASPPNESTKDSTNQYLDTTTDPMIRNFIESFRRHQQRQNQIFDNFFSSDSFREDEDIFKEMEQMHRQMMQLMNQQDRRSFDNNYQGWFQNRFGMAPDDVWQEEKDGNIRIHIRMEGEDTENIKVDVKKNAITITSDQNQKQEDKDADGNITRHFESRSSYVRSIPLPEGVDPGKVKFEKKKNEIVLVFPGSGEKNYETDKKQVPKSISL